MNRTEPSPMVVFTPPPWKLNGSSLGPQLFTLHKHWEGPPVGVALLLIFATLEPVDLLGPEKPLPNASGSAHAYTLLAFEPIPSPAALCPGPDNGDVLDEPAPNLATVV